MLNTFNHPVTLALAFVLLSCAEKKHSASADEPHRPQFHFSPPAYWMNDPNGMVYYGGEYHLFYQHYPDSTVWGPMHWGHAVSKDLIHWEHQPIALYPDSLGLIFSGSAVVDFTNTAGFKTGESDPLVAIYTYDKQGFETQALAFSNDKGRTWVKYENNPVLGNPGEQDYRDPKVFWHEASAHWIMSLAVRDRIEFYRSKNLKEWEKTGEFGQGHGSHIGVWECPDLFPLQVEGTNETKWVLLVSVNDGSPNGGSGTQYFIGDFDGTTFTNLNDPYLQLWIDYGRDNYAGVTWNNAPDNRAIFIGWMSNWNYAQVVPTENWRSAMTLPRDLSLRNTHYGIRLISNPVRETIALRNVARQSAFDKAEKHSGKIEVIFEVDLDASKATEFGLDLSNGRNERVRIGYNRITNRFYIDRTKAGKKDFAPDFADVQYAPRFSNDPIVSFRLFVDVASVELFADSGTTCMTAIFFPTENFDTIKRFNRKGELNVILGEWSELKSIW